MPKFTVSRADNLVYIDGNGRSVDCSALPSFLHAITWWGDVNPAYGQFEWNEDAMHRKLPNTRFSDFAPFQYLVDAWHLAPLPGGPNPNPMTGEFDADYPGPTDAG